MDTQEPNSGSVLNENPPVETNLKPDSKIKSNQLPIISLAAFIILSLGAIGFLYYQNQQLKAMLAKYQTPTPSPTPIATVDPTINWKTYTDEVHKISFRYPNEYEINHYAINDANSPMLLNNRIDWILSEKPLEKCSGDCPIITKNEQVNIGGMNATKIEGQIGSIGGGIPQSYISYEFKFPNENRYIYFTLWELLRGKAAMAENYLPDRKPGPISEKDVLVFDRIISTFKFNAKPVPAPTATPKTSTSSGVPSGY